MAKIDIRQLDEFAETFVTTVQDGDVPVWDNTNKEFVPQDPTELVVEKIVFRRAMLLMGG